MTRQNDQVYEFAQLDDYSLKDRILIRLADLLFFVSIRVLGALTRFEFQGQEHLDAVDRSGKLPIYAIWHDRIFLICHAFRNRGIVVLTSRSFDGEYISRSIQRFGFGAIRGSSSRGGAAALVEMVRAMRRGLAMGFTVDGPRGPRYEVKPGPILLAKKTGNPIVPLLIEPRRFWTLKSWDRTQIPKPFTRALVILGKPITVDPTLDDEETDRKLNELQDALDEITEMGRKWRNGD